MRIDQLSCSDIVQQLTENKQDETARFVQANNIDGKSLQMLYDNDFEDFDTLHEIGGDEINPAFSTSLTKEQLVSSLKQLRLLHHFNRSLKRIETQMDFNFKQSEERTQQLSENMEEVTAIQAQQQQALNKQSSQLEHTNAGLNRLKNDHDQLTVNTEHTSNKLDQFEEKFALLRIEHEAKFEAIGKQMGKLYVS